MYNKYKHTHEHLVTKAAEWLRKKGHTVVTTELVSQRETPDALGWKGGVSTLIECKITRSDFLSDRKKWFRRWPEDGIGQYRYYLCPENMVNVNELLPGWGLLEINKKRITISKNSQRFDAFNQNAESCILISLLRRIGQLSPKGISIQCYTYETGRTATLGIDINEAH